MICQHCGKVFDNDKLVYCVVCGYPLKDNKSFFSKYEDNSSSHAEESVIPRSERFVQPPAMSQPMMSQPPVMPQMGMPAQQPMMAQPSPMMMQQSVIPQPMGMVQQPVMQQPMGMVQQPVIPQPMTMMPQQSVIPQPMQMMPQQEISENAAPAVMPQMAYSMPQMQYGMPQLAGYDAAGNPIYMQMIPQIMGYDPYGNPLYTMVSVPWQPMPNMVSPQVPVMPAMQAQPMPVPQNMPQVEVSVIPVQEHTVNEQPPVQQVQTIPVPPVQQPPVQQVQTIPVPPVQQPPVQQVQAIPVPPVQQAQTIPVQPVQQPSAQQEQKQPEQSASSEEEVQQPSDQQPVREEQIQITSEEDIPVSAESLMNNEEASYEQKELPNEEALLNSIFSDAPKGYTMSSNVVPGAATFSINVSASEITNVRDEEVQPPEQEKPPARSRKKAEPKEEKAFAPKKKSAQPKKTQTKIVSPDEFFDDKPKNSRDTVLVPEELEKLDDDQLVEQLAAMEKSTGKKSRRSMKAASEEEIDLTNAVQEAASTTPTLPN